MNKPHFLIDAHLDLSMNAMDWNRDLRSSIQQIRDREKLMKDFPDRGNNVVNFDELRKGNIGLVVATQIARYVTPENSLPGWHSPQQAWAHTQAQLAWYREMEQAGELRQIRNLKELNEHLSLWETGEEKRIGYILSLEGADSIVDISYVEKAFDYGLRAIGPAHYGPGRYAQGTNASGGIGVTGRALLREMDQFNMILDATHLCDESFWEALNHFKGPVWASHHNCRSLVNHNRQLSDDMIKELIRRGAVIGAVLDAWMMVPNWQKGISTPIEMNCNLEKSIDHIDHICQIAGNTNHVAIGSDLDGGFGKEQCPFDIDTIADLQKFPQLLQKRGYQEQDIVKITSGNWLSFLQKNWK
jgi:membrane dipeptidase